MDFILAIQLMKGDRVEKIRVRDCNEGVVWLHEARLWAERSRIDLVDGPMYVCYPVDSPVIVRIRRE